MGEQDGVHTLLQAGAVTHQVEAPTGALALRADEWVGQPDRRHQVAARELGKYPGVDPVGLAGQRREPFHLLRVRDLDLPAGELEPSVHKARGGIDTARRLSGDARDTAVGLGTEGVGAAKRLANDTGDAAKSATDRLSGEIAKRIRRKSDPGS